MDIVTIIILALVAEAIWETIKTMWSDGAIDINRIGAMAVSLVVAFGAGADIFALVGIPLAIPFVGTFFTGLLISRGANFLHDLFEKIKL
jgi:fatty acid desaturase